MIIAEYKTAGGEVLPIREFKEGMKLLVASKTNKEEFGAYINTLTASGYKIHFKNETGSASEKPDNKNLFFTLTGTDCNIFAAYFPTLSRVQIIFDSKSPLHSYEKPKSGSIVPTVTQSYHHFGMSYVIKLCDGSLVVIDGGYTDKDYEEEFRKVIFANSGDGKRPTIAMWFFTHADPDHILLAADFMNDYGDSIDVRGFAYLFPDDTVYSRSSKEEVNRDVSVFEKSIKKNFPDTPIYPLYTGDVFYFAGVKVEVMFSFDIMYPGNIVTPNWESAAFRFVFDNNNTILFLGDCMGNGCKRMADIYGSYLKSDILQVAHHGLAGGNLEAYKYIDPQTCLWTSMKERFNGVFKREKEHVCIGEGGCDFNTWIRDDSIRKREHYHNSCIVTVNMDTLCANVSESFRKHPFEFGLYDEEFTYVYETPCADKKEFEWDNKSIIRNSFDESCGKYDRVSVATNKEYSCGTATKVELKLDKSACAGIFLTNSLCDNGNIPGDKLEIEVIKSGVSVWRKTVSEQQKLASFTLDVPENQFIEVRTHTKGDTLTVSLCGKTLTVANTDIPESFRIGISARDGEVCFKEICIVAES